MAYRSFEDLDVWKESCRLAVSVHELFRASRDYAMRDQIARSSISVPSNIAKGSCAEVRTQLYLSIKMGIVESTSASALLDDTKKISSKLQNLIKSLSDRIK